VRFRHRRRGARARALERALYNAHSALLRAVHAMSTIRSELRARRGLSQKPKLLGAQRARGALTGARRAAAPLLPLTHGVAAAADMTNALSEEPVSLS